MIDDNHLLANGTRVDLCWAGWFVWQQREWEATALWMDERMLQWRSSILMTTNSFFAEAGVVWMSNVVAGKGAALEFRKCDHWYVTAAAFAFASSFLLKRGGSFFGFLPGRPGRITLSAEPFNVMLLLPCFGCSTRTYADDSAMID